MVWRYLSDPKERTATTSCLLKAGRTTWTGIYTRMVRRRTWFLVIMGNILSPCTGKSVGLTDRRSLGRVEQRYIWIRYVSMRNRNLAMAPLWSVLAVGDLFLCTAHQYIAQRYGLCPSTQKIEVFAQSCLAPRFQIQRIKGAIVPSQSIQGWLYVSCTTPDLIMFIAGSAITSEDGTNDVLVH
jgi:hypothetical protein